MSFSDLTRKPIQERSFYHVTKTRYYKQILFLIFNCLEGNQTLVYGAMEPSIFSSLVA